MIFLYFLEIIVQIALIAFVISQVLLPIFTGGKLFPSFHRKDLEAQRRDAEELLERALEEQYIEHIKQKTVHVKSKGSTDDTNKST